MQTLVSVLVFIGLGGAMYFLFRRGIVGCCGGHGVDGCCRTTGSQKCASDNGGKTDYYQETADADEKG